MASLRPLLFALAAAGLVSCQAGLSALPACGQTCVTNMINDGASLNCVGDSLSCLCANPNFGFGIRDCADQNCGAAVASTVTSYASAMCATATLATAVVTTPSTTSAPPTTPPPPPPTTSSTLPATTLSSTSLPSSSVTPTTQTTAPGSSTTTLGSSPTSSSTPSAAAASGAAANSTASSDAASTTASSSTSPSNLTLAAKVGIGVGAAAGVAALLGVILCALHRCKQNRKAAAGGRITKESIHISDPMPGSGRIYASADGRGAVYGQPPKSGTGRSELEMTSRRYEDMVPRREPRIMV